MTPDAFCWVQSLDILHDQVWSRLARGVHDRHAPARHPTLATVSNKGRPQVRTVVLRAADEVTAALRVCTDLHSHKVAELPATPFAALHIWDNSAHLQIRPTVGVSNLTGTEVTDLWHKMPDQARLSYGTMPAPGSPVPDALGYIRTPDPQAFAVLEMPIDSIDLLHLGPHHRHAAFHRKDGWAGQWLAP